MPKINFDKEFVQQVKEMAKFQGETETEIINLKDQVRLNHEDSLNRFSALSLQFDTGLGEIKKLFLNHNESSDVRMSLIETDVGKIKGHISFWVVVGGVALSIIVYLGQLIVPFILSKVFGG